MFKLGVELAFISSGLFIFQLSSCQVLIDRNSNNDEEISLRQLVHSEKPRNISIKPPCRCDDAFCRTLHLVAKHAASHDDFICRGSEHLWTFATSFINRVGHWQRVAIVSDSVPPSSKLFGTIEQANLSTDVTLYPKSSSANGGSILRIAEEDVQELRKSHLKIVILDFNSMAHVLLFLCQASKFQVGGELYAFITWQELLFDDIEPSKLCNSSILNRQLENTHWLKVQSIGGNLSEVGYSTVQLLGNWSFKVQVSISKQANFSAVWHLIRQSRQLWPNDYPVQITKLMENIPFIRTMEAVVGLEYIYCLLLLYPILFKHDKRLGTTHQVANVLILIGFAGYNTAALCFADKEKPDQSDKFCMLRYVIAGPTNSLYLSILTGRVLFIYECYKKLQRNRYRRRRMADFNTEEKRREYLFKLGCKNSTKLIIPAMIFPTMQIIIGCVWQSIDPSLRQIQEHSRSYDAVADVITIYQYDRCTSDSLGWLILAMVCVLLPSYNGPVFLVIKMRRTKEILAIPYAGESIAALRNITFLLSMGIIAVGLTLGGPDEGTTICMVVLAISTSMTAIYFRKETRMLLEMSGLLRILDKIKPKEDPADLRPSDCYDSSSGLKLTGPSNEMPDASAKVAG